MPDPTSFAEEALVRLAALALLFLATLLPLVAALRRLPPGLAPPPADDAPPTHPAKTAEEAILAALALRLRPLAHLVHTLATALLAVLAILAVWAMAEPGRLLALLADPSPLEGISPRFLTANLLILAILIWLAAALEAPAAQAAAASPRLLALDPPFRLLVTAATTAGVFALYALLFDAFGGDWRNALAAVPGSLLGALRLESVAAVPLYAGLISGLPLLLAPNLAEAAAGRGPAPATLPLRLAATASAVGALAALILAL